MLIKDKYPFLPTSVIKLDRTKKVQKLREDRSDGWGKDKYSAESSRNKKGNFNLKLAEFILKYYAKESKTILDPFAGWGERGHIAQKLNYDYIGIDISKEAIEYAIENYNVYNILYNSQNIKLENGSIDFCYTCPPYFNLEKYESINGQLTDIKEYVDFLMAIKKNIEEIYRLLKINSLCSWVVGDFRIKNKFYDYSTDIINLFNCCGFELFDKVIIDKSVNYRISLFMKQAEKLGYTVKLHEYILTFKKKNKLKL